jgi:hypothetical protein
MESRECYHPQAEKHNGYTADVILEDRTVKYETKYKKDAQIWASNLSWLDGEVKEVKIYKED